MIFPMTNITKRTLVKIFHHEFVIIDIELFYSNVIWIIFHVNELKTANAKEFYRLYKEIHGNFFQSFPNILS